MYSFILLFVISLNKITSVPTELLELLVPFGVLICSLNTTFNKRQISKLLIWYIVFSLLLGISLIFYYGEGFTITKIYFLIGKNQIGTMLGISTVILGLWILDKNQLESRLNIIIFKIIIFVLLTASILAIRNRSGLIGIFITLFLAILKVKKFKLTVKNFIFIQIVLFIIVIGYSIGGFNSLIEIIFKSLFYNFDVTDLNSLSAGRWNVYKKSLDFVTQYPILGEMGGGVFLYGIPHNYILNKWVNFGFVGSLPLVLFYLYIWVFVFNNLLFKNEKIKLHLIIWVLFFSLIVSLFEYTYPYGPGVSQLMVWFMLGQYLKNNLDVIN